MITTSARALVKDMPVAIVGVGRMGVRHIQAVRELGMHVVGIADTREAALQDARKAYGLDASGCFADAAQMLKAVRPQALVVATTAPAHATLVKAGIDAGVRHILCEKPMAVSLAEADSMITACARANVDLAINHQMRFMPQYTKVKALIDTEALGPLVSMIVAGSNFGLAMNASHFFEAFRYLTGRSVIGVNAWFDDTQVPNPRGAQFEDRAGRLLAWGEAGQSMYIDFSAAAGHGLQVVYGCRQGQIIVDELSGDMRVVSRQVEYRDLPTTRYCMPADVANVPIEPVETVGPTVDVWSALLEGRAYPDGAAGVHALACVVAAHVSHEGGGRLVRLDGPDLPREREFKWA